MVERDPLVVVHAPIPPRGWGGVQQAAMGLIWGLSQLDAISVAVDAGADAAWLDGVSGPNVRVHTTPLARHRQLSALFRTATLAPITGRLRRLRPIRPRTENVRHRHPEAALVHFATQAAYLTDLPSIYQPWDLAHEHYPMFFTRHERRRRSLLYRRYAERATLVVVASAWTRQDVIDRLGLPTQKTRVVPAASMIDFVPPVTPSHRRDAARRLGLPETYIYYPAEAYPHKNHARLFEALAMLNTAGLLIPLVLSGFNDDSGSMLRSEAHLHGVEGQIRFLGYIDQADVRIVLEQATFLVFPSLFEGLGLPVVEAITCGRPVALSDVCGLPDLAGVAGIAFDPVDANSIAETIRDLWIDDDLRARLSAAAQTEARRFSWLETARSYRALYREVLRLPVTKQDQLLIARSMGGAH